VDVTAEPRADVLVERGPAPVIEPGRPVTVVGRDERLVVRVPVGVDLVIGTGSGRVTVRGSLGAVAVTTSSGRVEVDRAQRVDVRVRSAGVSVGEVDGEARVDTLSGRAQVGRAGSAHLSTVSGRIVIGHCVGRLRARTVSGRIEARVDGPAPDVDVETVSGRVDVRMHPGVHPRVEVSTVTGRVHHDLPVGDDGRVAARTVTGSVWVTAGAAP